MPDRPLPAQAFISSCAVAVFGREIPMAFAPCSARFKSFWCSSMRKPGIEGPLDHAFAMYFQNARVGKSAHECLTNFCRVSASLGSKQQRFGDCLNVQRDNDLIGHFCGLTIAITADQCNVLAHEFKQRLDRIEGRFIAANHDGPGRQLLRRPHRRKPARPDIQHPGR